MRALESDHVGNVDVRGVLGRVAGGGGKRTRAVEQPLLDEVEDVVEGGSVTAARASPISAVGLVDGSVRLDAS